MKFPFISRLALSILIVLILLALPAAPTFAASSTASEGKMGVVISLDTPHQISMGAPIIISGMIRDRLGAPVASKSITFYMAGGAIGQVSSDANGRFTRKFSKAYDAGTYKITAITKESHTLLAGSSTTTLKIMPAVVVIQTTPAIEGVAFLMNGEKFFSDADGIARISLSKVGSYRLTVLADQYHTATQKVEFGRWLEEIYQPFRIVQVPKETFIQVGLNVYHLMGQQFVGTDGFPVDSSRVSEFTFRSLQGDSFTFPDGTNRWIPASRVSRWKSILEVTPIYYSVSKVIIDGSNVVNQSEQRFFTSAGGRWQISLILYSLEIKARDGFFGTPVGNSVSLEYPDGHIQTFNLDSNGKITIHSLARGTYFIVINGVNGMKNRSPVALSRNQVVNSKILTSVDLALAGGLLLVLALALLFAGRPWLIQPLLRKQSSPPRPLVQEAGATMSRSTARLLARLAKSQNHLRSLQGNTTTESSRGLDRGGFYSLLIYLEHTLPESTRLTTLDLSQQLILTLKYIHGNASVRELAETHRVSESTVRRTIKRINTALMSCGDFSTRIESRPMTQDAVSHSRQYGNAHSVLHEGSGTR